MLAMVTLLMQANMILAVAKSSKIQSLPQTDQTGVLVGRLQSSEQYSNHSLLSELADVPCRLHMDTFEI